MIQLSNCGSHRLEVAFLASVGRLSTSVPCRRYIGSHEGPYGLCGSRRQLSRRCTMSVESDGDPRICLVYSDKFLKHRAPGEHPERPARLSSIVEALRNEESLKEVVEWRKPTALSEERREKVLKAVLEVHDEEYLEELRELAERGGGALDADTYVHPESYETALLAVSAWLDAVDYALDRGRGAFALARPPGHHAMPGYGMGFCLLSNAAIAARYGLSRGLKSIAILDWDVHHGNGTEAVVKKIKDIRFCSSHQYPWYPFSTGQGDFKGKLGNVLNVPLSSGTGMDTYEAKFEEKMLPFLLKKDPELVIVSAGYDALEVDPLAELTFQPKDFRAMTEKLLQKMTHAKVVFGLEGGYNLEGISEAVVETVKGYCKDPGDAEAEVSE